MTTTTTTTTLVFVVATLFLGTVSCFIPKHQTNFRFNTFQSTSSLAATTTTTTKTFQFRNKYPIHTEYTPAKQQQQTFVFDDIFSPKKSKTKPKILLIHGFGASTTYWRNTISTLSNSGYDVHALDLLGQGQSSKPNDVTYSIRLWSELVDEYAHRVIFGNGNVEDGGLILMGNSLGSLVALSAAVGDHEEGNDTFLKKRVGNGEYNTMVKGICMYNCGIGLNSRNVANEPQWNPIQRFVLNLLFDGINALIFANIPLLTYVLNNIVTKDLLRDALIGLYKYDPNRVDDELVDSFYEPAKDDGAPGALSQIYCNDPGLTPMQLHERYGKDVLEKNGMKIHLIWGDEDAVTPLGGGVGTFYKEMADDDGNDLVSMDVISSGHLPFDDNVVDSNESMLKWLNGL